MIPTGDIRSDAIQEVVACCHHEAPGTDLIIPLVQAFNPGLIIELGTCEGGLTILFANTCPEAQIRTFDVVPPKARIDLIPNVKFQEGDILKDEKTIAEVRAMLQNQEPKKKVLYCDNGNKEEEMRKYAEYLQSGDLLGCHDYGTEVHLENIQEAIKGFEPYQQESFEKVGVSTRFWRKI